MFNSLNTSSPLPTEYASEIYANLRLIKSLFEERYSLDHYLNPTDTNPTDAHNKVTLKPIVPDLYKDKMPFPMNWEAGIAEMLNDTGIIITKKSTSSIKLYFITKINNQVKEVEIC